MKDEFDSINQLGLFPLFLFICWLLSRIFLSQGLGLIFFTYLIAYTVDIIRIYIYICIHQNLKLNNDVGDDRNDLTYLKHLGIIS